MTGDAAFRRAPVFASACLGMLVVGIVLTTLRAVLPELIERFAISKAEAGSLFSLLSFGILVGSLVFGPIVDRFAYRPLLLASLALIFVGLEGLGGAPSFGWLRPATLVVGLGTGVINGASNALVADISEGERSADLSLLGIFFGIGAVGVPLALSFLLRHFTYASLISAIGFLVVVPFVLTALTRFPAPKQAQGVPLRAGARLLRDPVLLLFGMMLFLESGMEMTIGGWSTTYFAEELAISPDRALRYLSLYWLGMMLGRLALATVFRRTAPARALLMCIAIGLAGSILLLATRGLGPAAAGIFLVGVGFAGGFPIVLGFVGDRYAALSGTAFSIVFVMALTGGMTIPYLAGVLGGAYGLRASFVIVPLGLAAIALLLSLVARLRQTRAVATT